MYIRSAGDGRTDSNSGSLALEPGHLTLPLYCTDSADSVGLQLYRVHPPLELPRAELTCFSDETGGECIENPQKQSIVRLQQTQTYPIKERT